MPIVNAKHKIAENARSASETSLHKNRKIQQQMLPPVSIERGPEPFGPNAHLSELLRHVLLGRSA